MDRKIYATSLQLFFNYQKMKKNYIYTSKQNKCNINDRALKEEDGRDDNIYDKSH